MISKLTWCVVVIFQSQLLQQLKADTQQRSTNSFAKNVDNFGASLTKAIGQNNNLFISPLSIFNALAMTYIGARGNTAKEMEVGLQLAENGLGQTELNEAFKNYLSTVGAGNDKYSLFIANAIFQQETFVAKDDYINDVRQFYNGSVQKEDFAHDGNKAVDDINKFVAENTQNKIEKLFEEPLDPRTVLVLVNAIYFKGTWKVQFPKDKTSDGIFHKNDGSNKTVKFMRMVKEKLRYFEDIQTGYQYLELPYKGEDIAMIIALPHDYESVPVLDMTSELLREIDGNLTEKEIEHLAIPKFQLKYKKELKNILPKLGINDLFTDSSNLSGISEPGNLKVSSVLHESIIDVNEEGSEAAAVTGIVIVPYSFPLNQIIFTANHPFLFYIIDKRNMLILFAGRVSDL